MSNTNLNVWNKLAVTDPAHTTTFKRAGGFSGTAVKPIYTIKKMTELFGPIGQKWGADDVRFETVRADNGEVLVFCTVSVWARLGVGNDPVAHGIHGVGGDKVAVLTKDGTLRTNDEAYKMAFTDAVGNALKYLGMSADVHMGLFDDSKYVREVSAQITKSAQRDIYDDLLKQIDESPNVNLLAVRWLDPAFQAEMKKLSPEWQAKVTEEKNDRKKALEAQEAALVAQDDMKGAA